MLESHIRECPTEGICIGLNLSGHHDEPGLDEVVKDDNVDQIESTLRESLSVRETYFNPLEPTAWVHQSGE
jgi:hypothetical protein